MRASSSNCRRRHNLRKDLRMWYPLEVCIFYFIEVRHTKYDIDWVRVVDMIMMILIKQWYRHGAMVSKSNRCCKAVSYIEQVISIHI